MHFGSAKTQSRSCRVDGDAPAPDHHHAVSGDLWPAAQPDVAQERCGDQDAIQVDALDGQLASLVRTDRDQNCIETFIEDVVQAVDARVETQFNTEVNDVLHLTVHDLRGQTVGGHAHAQHPAGDRQRLKDGDPISQVAQVLGGRQPTGTGTDDCHVVLVLPFRRLWRHSRLGIDFVGHESLQRMDVDRVIQLAAVAGILTAVVAYAPADAWEWVVLLDDTKRVIVPPFANQSDVPLSPLSRRAGVATRRDATLLYREGVRYGLRVELMGDALSSQPLVELARYDHGTDFLAVAATRALVDIDVARTGPDASREVAGLPAQTKQVAVDKQLNVAVAPAVDQLGAHDAHRAVVRGEGLVQLRHMPTDGGLLLDEVHLVPGFSQVQ